MATLRFARPLLVTAAVTAANLAILGTGTVSAQPQAAVIPRGPATAPPTTRLTLDDARQRILANHKLLKLAALNVQGKGHATSAARSDYFPKVIGNTVYLRFTDPLGSVVTTQGRPVLGIPARTRAVNVLNQRCPRRR